MDLRKLPISSDQFLEPKQSFNGHNSKRKLQFQTYFGHRRRNSKPQVLLSFCFSDTLDYATMLCLH